MYTSHGHHIPNTYHDPKQDPIAEKCGGVKTCVGCKAEVERIEIALSELEDVEEVYSSNFCVVHHRTHIFGIDCHG